MDANAHATIFDAQGTMTHARTGVSHLSWLQYQHHLHANKSQPMYHAAHSSNTHSAATGAWLLNI